MYDVAGANKVYGVVGNHGPEELVLYCKLYEDMGDPPLSDGSVQITVLV